MSTTFSSLPANMAAHTRPNFIGSVKDEWELFSDNSEDYTVGSPIGFGASSIVYTANFQPDNSKRTTPCALKVVDLERLPPHALSLLQRETTLMSLSKHPNVLRVRGSWMDGHKLYIALRLMNKGSAADVMRYGWPGGMDEDVVRCILQQALQGLNYLHVNGFIHRDIKAANLLIDDDGTVLLGDLGVSANLAEPSDGLTLSSTKSRQYTRTTAAILSQPKDNGTHSSTGSGKRVVIVDPGHPNFRAKIGKRKSFVGTPCWMAPELIQGRNYDSSADIWSFGITALELTQGRPPRSRDPPQKVLMRTIQDEPPSLNRDGGTYKYSKAFKDMVDSCLVKDPSKRPTAEQLLQTPFFRASKKKSYLVGAILKDLPPLTQRQERRAAASVYLKTVDSWDFATTVAESTHSYYRRSLFDTIVPEDPTPIVFDMDSEGDSSSVNADEETDPESPNPQLPDDPSYSKFDPGSSSESSSPLDGTGTSLSSLSSSPFNSSPPSSAPSSSVGLTATGKLLSTKSISIERTKMASPINASSTLSTPESHTGGTISRSPREPYSASTGPGKHPNPPPTCVPSKRPSTSSGRLLSSSSHQTSIPPRPSSSRPRSSSSNNVGDSSGSFWRKLTKRDSKIVLKPIKSRDEDVSGTTNNGYNSSNTGTIRGKTAMKMGSFLARAGGHLATASTSR